MAVLALRVILAAFLLENNNPRSAGLANDPGHNRCPTNSGRPDFRFVSADHQHFVERDLVFLGAAEDIALDEEVLPFCDPILLST